MCCHQEPVTPERGDSLKESWQRSDSQGCSDDEDCDEAEGSGAGGWWGSSGAAGRTSETIHLHTEICTHLDILNTRRMRLLSSLNRKALVRLFRILGKSMYINVQIEHRLTQIVTPQYRLHTQSTGQPEQWANWSNQLMGQFYQGDTWWPISLDCVV